MKLREVKVTTITGADASALDAAWEAFREEAAEKTFLGMFPVSDTSILGFVVYYTD